MATEKKWTIDDILTQAKAPERIVEVCLRPDLAVDLKLAQLALEREGVTTSLAGSSARKSLARIRAQIEASMVSFRIRALSDAEIEEVNTTHPDTGGEDAADEAADDLRRAYILSKQIIEPAMTPEQVLQLGSTLQAEFAPVYQAAVEVRTQRLVEAPFWRKTSGDTQG